eukprot:NODE_78_length_23230_cov_1.644979.p8 type:complete len:332 gc:universal NODE_78_length_23230_cov_1.644979:4750-3755(-)
MSWASMVAKNVGDKNGVKRTPQAIQIQPIKEIQRAGLINTKNDCFFHIVLQVLATIPNFSWDIDHPFCAEMENFKKLLYSNEKPFFPTNFHSIMESHHSNFLKQQQDVTECFHMIIDMLHENLKNEDNNIEAKNEEEDSSWLEVGYKNQVVKTRNYSLHQSPFLVFYGQLCNLITKKGKLTTKSFEPFLFLSIELFDPVQKVISEYTLRATREFKKPYFNSLPNILTIQLKRFYYHKERGLCKSTKNAIYPKTLSVPITVDDEQSYIRYDLYAIIYHNGATLDSGHYTCAIEDSKLKSWIIVDDTNVFKISQQEALNNKRNEAYMLMYVKQ